MKLQTNKSLSRRRGASVTAILAAAIFSAAASPGNPLPQVVNQNGRHALLVDGAPFLILGAQCHNSSDWPGLLPKVWPAIEDLHANTLEIPVYWEQFEPAQGRFDTSIVDLILRQAREHQARLVLLWFGTWKNGSSHYLPLWAKSRPDLFPRMVARDGRRVDSPSPFAPAALQADLLAFSALMRHLKSADPVHTVIMVQVENEPGTWGGTVRDYSPEAEKAFGEYLRLRRAQPRFANARSVRNALERARLRQAGRLVSGATQQLSKSDLVRIEADDIRRSRVFGEEAPDLGAPA